MNVKLFKQFINQVNTLSLHHKLKERRPTLAICSCCIVQHVWKAVLRFIFLATADAGGIVHVGEVKAYACLRGT
jgi:hypothetical protein